jgi:mono/diheme cytochrome c family protein
MRSFLLLSIVLLSAAAAACTDARKSATGFHLPDGDVAKGRTVFVELRCHSCHEVAGVAFAAPVADPPVPVVLGGIVPQARSDGELVAAIIDPSHRLTGHHPKTGVRSGTLSRMGDFSEAMTARQLIDLVAFLQSTYDVQPPVAGP